MLHRCRGLVIRDHGIVRFAHHTVQQYLLSEDTRSPEFTRSIKEAELFVGTMCLTYLSFSDFETQIEIRRPEVKAGPPLDLFQKGVGVQSLSQDLDSLLVPDFKTSILPSREHAIS